MNETMIWVAVAGGGGGSLVAFLTFWMALSSRITTAENMAKKAEEMAGAADRLAAASIAKQEHLSLLFNEYKVETAAKVATLQAVSDATSKALAQTETRLLKSIEGVGDKVDVLSKTVIELAQKAIR